MIKPGTKTFFSGLRHSPRSTSPSDAFRKTPPCVDFRSFSHFPVSSRVLYFSKFRQRHWEDQAPTNCPGTKAEPSEPNTRFQPKTTVAKRLIFIGRRPHTQLRRRSRRIQIPSACMTSYRELNQPKIHVELARAMADDDSSATELSSDEEVSVTIQCQ